MTENQLLGREKVKIRIERKVKKKHFLCFLKKIQRMKIFVVADVDVAVDESTNKTFLPRRARQQANTFL